MTKRNIGLEWLRIVSMLMIILLHSIDHSGLYESLIPGTKVYICEQFLYSMVQVCVNCFVLISGYFLVNSRFKVKKILSLWITVVFYSVITKLICMIAGIVPFSITSLASCFLPVITGRYWFVTIYIGMYILSPFFNIAIKAMDKKQFKGLLLILFLLFSVWISIHPQFKGMNSAGGWGIAWFTVLYFTAAYFRLHYTPKGKKGLALIIFFACPVVITIGTVLADKLNVNALSTIIRNMYRYDSVTSFVASVALLIFFLNCQCKYNERVSALIIKASAATFGVYLIHAHANICVPEMWQKIGMVSLASNWWFPLYQICIVIIIFVVCAFIDIIRMWLFKAIKVDKLAEMVSEKIQSLLNIIK